MVMARAGGAQHREDLGSGSNHEATFPDDWRPFLKKGLAFRVQGSGFSV